jgi:phenylacetate-coenzyme A ligase PaaK-like adenylate-forming protein
MNAFGSTEGLVGVSAPDDEVLSFAEDGCIAELVDAEGRPVPLGTPSAKVLVTNLENPVQPLIRYEIGDSFVAVAGEATCVRGCAAAATTPSTTALPCTPRDQDRAGQEP